MRYFTARESARLQTFPDDFVVHGAMVGNHAPVGQRGSAAGRRR